MQLGTPVFTRSTAKFQIMAYGSARNPYAMEKTGLRRKSNLLLTFVLFITVYILYVFTNYALSEKNNHPYSTEKIGGEDLKINHSTGPVVAYAISLTSCTETPTFIDGAAPHQEIRLQAVDMIIKCMQ